MVDLRTFKKLAEATLDGVVGRVFETWKVRGDGGLPGLYLHYIDGTLYYVGMSFVTVSSRWSAFKGSFEDIGRNEAHGPLYRELFKGKKKVIRVLWLPLPDKSREEIEAIEEYLIDKHKPVINCHHN